MFGDVHIVRVAIGRHIEPSQAIGDGHIDCADSTLNLQDYLI